jgi:outer membrane protein assembly factor BamB
MDLEGRRTYVYCASGGVVGVSAEDGRILWEFDDWKIRIANVPSPLVIGDGRVLLTGGYNAGSLMLRIRQAAEGFAAEPVFRLNYRTFGAQQQTPILYQGFIYGVRQDGQLVCLDLDGKVAWASGSAARFGLGPYLIADGLLLVMDDSGLLTLAEAAPAGYRRLAQAKVLTGPDCWGPMALAGGRLILRGVTTMKCLDLAAR